MGTMVALSPHHVSVVRSMIEGSGYLRVLMPFSSMQRIGFDAWQKGSLFLSPACLLVLGSLIAAFRGQQRLKLWWMGAAVGAFFFFSNTTVVRDRQFIPLILLAAPWIADGLETSRTQFVFRSQGRLFRQTLVEFEGYHLPLTCRAVHWLVPKERKRGRKLAYFAARITISSCAATVLPDRLFLAADHEISALGEVVLMRCSHRFPAGLRSRADIAHSVESLEGRLLLAADLASALEQTYDVNGDGQFTPADILRVVNHINHHGPHELEEDADGGHQLDVNHDGAVTPADALGMINAMNSNLPIMGAPKPSGEDAQVASAVNAIAADVAAAVTQSVSGPVPTPAGVAQAVTGAVQARGAGSRSASLVGSHSGLQDLQVTVEVRFVTLNDSFFDEIGIDFDFDVDDAVSQLPVDNDGPQIDVDVDVTGQGTDKNVFVDPGDFRSLVSQTPPSFGFAILTDVEVFFLLDVAGSGQTPTTIKTATATIINPFSPDRPVVSTVFSDSKYD